MAARPRTVVFLLESLSGGGAERNALALMDHLPASEWRVVLVLQRRAGSLLSQLPKDQTLEILEEQGPAGNLALSRTLARVLRRCGADLLFTSLSRPNALAGLLKLQRLHPVPWVASEHNNLQRILDSQPWHHRIKRQLVFRWCYPKAASVVAVSAGLAASLEREYGLPRSQLQTIHNPVDGPGIRRRVEEGPGGSRSGSVPRIVACGRLIHQKGFDVLLEALARVTGPVPPELVIVGDGARRPELEAQARTLGLADRVRFTGFLLNPWQELAQGDVFVLSSRWEGFGNVLIEAMACGLPVIACDCDFGPREILTDGVDGLLVAPEDPGALARGISRLLGDSSLAGRLAEQGRRRAGDFSAQTIVPQYAALFDRVIRHAAPAGPEA